jgi:mannosyl-oligosaccharide alpha-1,2-mannosidase
MGGFGATIVDSLDTLLVMGMNEEFHQGLEWIKTSLSFDRSCAFTASCTDCAATA